MIVPSTITCHDLPIPRNALLLLISANHHPGDRCSRTRPLCRHRQSRGRRAVLKEKSHFPWLSSWGERLIPFQRKSCRTMLTTPPPFTRRLAGSSVTEATRGVHEIG